ncbi:ComF family protein [Rhodobacterales bacterium HKCCE2091]|nr:ComF family protein [Rhodobacterales bacterium HKCCE2091]
MGLQTALHAVFPPECLGCGGSVTTDFGLCPDCWSGTAFIHATICDACGAPLPGEAAPGERVECDECRATPRPWEHGRAAFLYEGTGRRLVLGLKHGDRAEIARAAGPWLLRAGRGIVTPETVVVPVPLSRWRLLKRRYNQSALLSQALARAAGAGAVPDALVRIRHTPSLDGRTREDRARILDGAIAPHRRRGALLSGRDVVIVDDVMTSGATFAAATHAARCAGARSVSVIALARVARET